MAKEEKKILIVDDEFGARESLKIILESDYMVLTAENYQQAFPKILNEGFDLILLDICMPEKSGLDLLRDIRGKGIKIPVIMVTATKTLKTAVEAMKYGASDYVTKPYDVEEIREVVRENLSLRKTEMPLFAREQIIGHNTTLKPVFRLIDRLQNTDSTVLILGESGTGKELIAKEIHFGSNRKNQAFIPVHLSSIPENLVESELFGHVKGSFTGADRDRKGALELGDQGTIFLDEIGEISESVQIKLLRVIQEREYKPVGESRTKRTNARIIAATNKDLYQMVKEGKFRADLYYRLNVVPITLPPLRERKTDIEVLSRFLISKICNRIKVSIPELHEDVIKAFTDHEWKGNVRELENTLENMVLMSDKYVLGIEDLPPAICDHVQQDISPEFKTSDEKYGQESVFSSLERETIQLALLRNNGVLTSTAKYLGTTRRVLKYKMDKLGIEKSDLFSN